MAIELTTKKIVVIFLLIIIAVLIILLGLDYFEVFKFDVFFHLLGMGKPIAERAG